MQEQQKQQQQTGIYEGCIANGSRDCCASLVDKFRREPVAPYSFSTFEFDFLLRASHSRGGMMDFSTRTWYHTLQKIEAIPKCYKNSMISRSQSS